LKFEKTHRSVNQEKLTKKRWKQLKWLYLTIILWKQKLGSYHAN
jgi:hypothetical protein